MLIATHTQPLAYFHLLSRYSKLFYTINTSFFQFHIALPHSFAPTAAFHQSRSSLRSFFKTTVGTKQYDNSI